MRHPLLVRGGVTSPASESSGRASGRPAAAPSAPPAVDFRWFESSSNPTQVVMPFDMRGRLKRHPRKERDISLRMFVPLEQFLPEHSRTIKPLPPCFAVCAKIVVSSTQSLILRARIEQLSYG